MKKNPLTQKALDDWNYSLNEPTEEDAALQQWKDDLKKAEIKDKAGKVKQILAELKLTQRQKEIFYLFVEIGSYRKVGKRLGITHTRVMEIVNKIQRLVKDRMMCVLV